jgi:hypothetical protein
MEIMFPPLIMQGISTGVQMVELPGLSLVLLETGAQLP